MCPIKERKNDSERKRDEGGDGTGNWDWVFKVQTAVKTIDLWDTITEALKGVHTHLFAQHLNSLFSFD